MKFLLCTDGSAGSRSILPHAGRLARALGAEIVLARVLDPRVDAASEVAPRLEDAVARVQAGWEDELRKGLAEANLDGEVMVPQRLWGKEIADAIDTAAEDTAAALIGITSRGSGKVRHALFGSVALGVLERANRPVMTLAKDDAPVHEGSAPYHLVVTSDGSPDSRSIFAGLDGLLAPGKVKVTLLEVVTLNAKETESEAEARGLADLEPLRARIPAGVEVHVKVEVAAANSDVALCIGDAARDLGADAIASSTHGHSARRHVVAGSTALGVVEKSGLPVILVKSQAVD
jgi:nucleotide-binding universal stress UspA family protein